MPSIHLHLQPEQDARTRELARQLELSRSAYVRRAVDEFNARVERQLLADRFRKVSQQCREESLQVCREFEALDDLPAVT